MLANNNNNASESSLSASEALTEETQGLNSAQEAKRKQFLERMEKRNEDMKQRKTQEAKENPALFWNSFNELISQQKSAHELQQFLNQHVHYLPNYDVRKADEKIREIQSEMKKDKKVFSFKKKTPQEPTQKKEVTVLDTPSPIKLPETNKTVIDLSTMSTGVHDVVPTKENESFSICNGSQNHVRIRQIVGAVYISNLVDCTIELGPVNGAIFLSKCQNCTFQLACWQLRIHDSTSCKFFICPKNNPIIENCTTLQFGRYSLNYENLASQLKSCDMNVEDDNKNKWNRVHDFNWLKTNEPSPNFCYV